MHSIPLASPTGAVYAYACGVCHNVHAGQFALGGRDDASIREASEDYRASAEGCCRCKRCKREIATLDFFYCNDCTPLARAEQLLRDREREAEANERDRAVEESLAQSTNETSARALQEVMSDLSEENWCAEWSRGCEFELWAALKGFDRASFVEIDTKSLKDLDVLSQAAGGWWHLPAGAASPLFVTFAEWQKIWDARGRVDGH